MDQDCSVEFTLTPVPHTGRCHLVCANVTFTVGPVTCRHSADGKTCIVSYTATRTNPDGTQDVLSGTAGVPDGGCKEIALHCDPGETCIHSKLQLCCL